MAKGAALAALVLGMALGGLVSGMPAGAAGPHGRPFSATLHETVVPPDVCVPAVSCLIIETGTISGSLTGSGTVDVVRNIVYGFEAGCAIAGTSTETVTIVARSGQLFVSSAGTFCIVAGVGTETGTLTITGGTGRFAGASGTGTYSFTEDPLSASSVEDWVGTIA